MGQDVLVMFTQLQLRKRHVRRDRGGPDVPVWVLVMAPHQVITGEVDLTDECGEKRDLRLGP
jgi:hypothetical protein